MGKSIFNISEDYLNIVNELEESLGDMTPELEARLKVNEEELAAKVKAYCYIISLTEGEIKVIDDEVERLNNLKKTKEKLVEKLKEVLLNATLLFGTDGKTGNKKLDFDTVKLWTVNRDSVNILDEMKISNDYCTFSLANKIDNSLKQKIEEKFPELGFDGIISKTKIKEAIEAGKEVSGATVVTKPSIRIK